MVAAVAWAGGRLFGGLTRAVLRRVSAHTASTWDDKLLESISPPIKAAWTLVIFWTLGHSLGLSLPAERLIGNLVRGLSVATLFWAIWRSVNVIVGMILSRPWAASNPSTRHLLTIGANLAKGAIGVLGGLALLAAFGYPVTTLLCGPGHRHLALAFGAQKTVENLFGSMSLAVNQPFRVGDFVKVEDFMGTVEDIGLRSTRTGHWIARSSASRTASSPISASNRSPSGMACASRRRLGSNTARPAPSCSRCSKASSGSSARTRRSGRGRWS